MLDWLTLTLPLESRNRELPAVSCPVLPVMVKLGNPDIKMLPDPLMALLLLITLALIKN